MAKRLSYGQRVPAGSEKSDGIHVYKELHAVEFVPGRVAPLETGAVTKNIPIDRIVEDIVFKDSAKSYFIQLADFCAYALRRRERPIPSRSKYGIHTVFNADLGDDGEDRGRPGYDCRQARSQGRATSLSRLR